MSRPYTKTHMLVALAIVFAAGYGTVALIVEWLERPEVHWSHSHNRCVRVVDHKAKRTGEPSPWSCGNLPAKYDHVWVR